MVLLVRQRVGLRSPSRAALIADERASGAVSGQRSIGSTEGERQRTAWISSNQYACASELFVHDRSQDLDGDRPSTTFRG